MHVLLTELLQAIEPRDNTDGPEEEGARRSKERLAMSEAMLKKYGGNGLGKKPRSDSSSEIVLDAEEITERVMQKMGYNMPIHGNNIEFFGRVTQEEEPLGNYKQYGVLTDQS